MKSIRLAVSIDDIAKIYTNGFISKHLNIDSELINKFIYIALACDLIQEIPAHEAKLKFNNEDNTPSTLRSFFSKMRKKLGI